MSSAAPISTELSAGRFFILFQAALRTDGVAPMAWQGHRDEAEWDHVVNHALGHALQSQAGRALQQGATAPTATWRHVRGGVAEATAAASQLLSKGGGLAVLVCYVGGPGQAEDLETLASALHSAVTGAARLTVFIGDWRRGLGHAHQWERVFQAFTVNGPDTALGVPRPPHPVFDHLRPELAAVP